MSDVADTTTQPAATETGATASAETKTTDKQPIPYERFYEVNKELTDLKKWKQEQEAAAAERAKKEQDAEAERLRKQGEFEKLAESEKKRADELTPYKERTEKLEASLNKRWEAEKKDVPDYLHPLLEKMSVDERLDYITENREKWEKASPNGVGSNPNSSTGKGLTTEEQAKRHAGMRRAIRGM